MGIAQAGQLFQCCQRSKFKANDIDSNYNINHERNNGNTCYSNYDSNFDSIYDSNYDSKQLRQLKAYGIGK